MWELEDVLRTRRLSLVLNWRFVKMDTEINIRFLVPLKMTTSLSSTQSDVLCNTHPFSKLAKDTWLNSQSLLSTPLTTFKKIFNSTSHSDWLAMLLQLLNLTSLLTYGREFLKSQRKLVYSKWTETENKVKLNLLTHSLLWLTKIHLNSMLLMIFPLDSTVFSDGLTIQMSMTLSGELLMRLRIYLGSKELTTH
jgi:hypothetical protein